MQTTYRTLICSVCTGALLLTLSSMPGSAQPASPVVIPPEAQFHGKSLTGWLESYWIWNLTGTPASGQENGVLFLPMPSSMEPSGQGTAEDPVILVGHADVTIKAGTPFVLPLIAWMGETYQDGHVDAALPDSWLGTWYGADVQLDNRAIVQDAQKYYVPVTYFDEPIMYAQPTDYGSTGVVFSQGIGFVCAPLSVGTHTLNNRAWFAVPPDNGLIGATYLEFHNSWTITVVP